MKKKPTEIETNTVRKKKKRQTHADGVRIIKLQIEESIVREK